jgi:deazaflavin-dependent oxidoreductase (nitroreductase family)
MVDLTDRAHEAFCYLTTRGRVTGDAHEIEIWFAARGSTIYMLSGGGATADWVKNLTADPQVEVRVGGEHFGGRARVVAEPEEEAWARTALFEKYDPTYSGDLTKWSQTALPVAVDLAP